MMLFKKSPAGNRRGIDMMQGPILKNLLLFSVPMILSGVLQLLFSAADIAVAGRFIADAALAASLFHYKELEINQVKSYLRDKGVAVRL